jgi:hypothetical protein
MLNAIRMVRTAAIALTLSSAAWAAGWSVGDDGQKAVASDVGTTSTYRVHNNGPDGNVTLVVKKADGTIVKWFNLAHGDDQDVGLAAGQSLWIDDRDYSGSQTAPTISSDSNTFGATGTYTTV